MVNVERVRITIANPVDVWAHSSNTTLTPALRRSAMQLNLPAAPAVLMVPLSTEKYAADHILASLKEMNFSSHPPTVVTFP